MTCPFCGSLQVESLPRGWTFCARCGLACRQRYGVVCEAASTNHSHPHLAQPTQDEPTTRVVLPTPKKGMDVTLLSNPRRKPEQWR